MDKLRIDFLLSSNEVREPPFTLQQFKIEPPNKERILEITSFAVENGKAAMLYNRTSSKPNSLYQHIIQKKVEKVMKDSSDNLRFQPYQKKQENVSSFISSLRAQTYCGVLSAPLKDGDGNKFRCTFSGEKCDKIIKGKGNLRRHIEWHLRRVEDEYKHNHSLSQNEQVTAKNVTNEVPQKISFNDPEVAAKESEALEILGQNFRSPAMMPNQ